MVYVYVTCISILNVDLDECESDPCANGGDCENRDNAFSCTCLAGYTGTNCETGVNGLDECHGNETRLLYQCHIGLLKQLS